MILSITIIILMLLLSAMFSGMEIAFISTNKFHLEIKEIKNDFSNKILSKLISKSSDFISTLLICNNLTLVIYGIYSSEIIKNWIFNNSYADEMPLYIMLSQTVIATVVVFIIAEFLPKIFFLKNPFKMINIFIIPTYIFHVIITFTGIRFIINIISNGVGKLIIGKNYKEKNISFGKIELNNLLQEQVDITGNDNQNLKKEIDIIQNTIEFSDLKIKNCLIPRNEIQAIDVKSDIETLKELFIKTGFSKAVVYKENIENILGYVHLYDVLKSPKTIKEIIIKLNFLPETLSLYDGMNKIIQSKKSISGVIDEYGEISGIITLEDILEEIFGDIEDEFDNNNLKEVVINKNQYIFSSRLEVSHINEKYNLKLPESENYETLNGLVLNYLENIPEKGDFIIIENFFKFDIQEVLDTKIDILKLTILS